jgi:hypothetical protein
MDYEKRLSTLRKLFDELTQKVKEENLINNSTKVHESQSHLKQIESEINRITKMRSYKK